jgi:hypothetical protein
VWCFLESYPNKLLSIIGTTEWIRTTDPYHVKVVL